MRLAGPSRGTSKRVSGVDGNGSQTAAQVTLVSRCNKAPSPFAGRFLLPGSLAVFGLANSLGFAFNGACLIVLGAFRSMEHHAGDDRCMIVRGDQVVIARWDRET